MSGNKERNVSSMCPKCGDFIFFNDIPPTNSKGYLFITRTEVGVLGTQHFTRAEICEHIMEHFEVQCYVWRCKKCYACFEHNKSFGRKLIKCYLNYFPSDFSIYFNKKRPEGFKDFR